MRFALTLGLTCALSLVFLGCGDASSTNPMNPGTVADGADAAKVGLQAAGPNDMKNTLKPSNARKTAP
jgi:hypothetical protein